MSDRLYLRGTCELLYEGATPDPYMIKVDKSLENYSFSVSNSGQNIEIKLLKDGKTIEFESVIDSFKPNTLQILRTKDYNKLSDTEKTELHGITHPVREAVKRFAGLLKQELPRYDIRDELIANVSIEWSIGDNQWHSTPRRLTADVRIYSLGNLPEETANHLQKLLAEDEGALIATSYLHHSRNILMNRRYQWIYATIAAELAVKEILVRIEPKLRVILEELPSPSLKKLYGKVLQSIADVKLSRPDLARLQEGAIRRNELIHNPKSETPSFQEVNEYINFVENKINWLLEQWRSMKAQR
jgi:hypothetical protein